MYTNFYKLNAKPFESNPESRFLYLGEQHKEALALLLFAVRQRKSLVLLSGPAGTGKTTLVNVLTRLEPTATFSFIVNPYVELIDFYRLMFHDFGIKEKCETKADFLIALDDFLKSRCETSAQVVLLVDEAQGLSSDVLHEIRYILNVGARYPGTLQIILSGQPEIRELITDQSLQNLQQRISLHFKLGPLGERETRAYIEKRLTEAGNPPKRKLFDDQGYAEIAWLSGGIPRIINSICDNALLLGYLKRLPLVDRETIIESVKDLDMLGLPPPRDMPATPPPSRHSWFRRWFATDNRGVPQE